MRRFRLQAQFTPGIVATREKPRSRRRGGPALVSKQVHALAGDRVLSVGAAGSHHLLAVTPEEGELFGWGLYLYGQCGNGSSSRRQLLPRHMQALMGIRARSAFPLAGATASS